MKTYFFLISVFVFLSILDYLLLPPLERELNPFLRAVWNHKGYWKLFWSAMFVFVSTVLSAPLREYVVAGVSSIYFCAVILEIGGRLR